MVKMAGNYIEMPMQYYYGHLGYFSHFLIALLQHERLLSELGETSRRIASTRLQSLDGSFGRRLDDEAMSQTQRRLFFLLGAVFGVWASMALLPPVATVTLAVDSKETVPGCT